MVGGDQGFCEGAAMGPEIGAGVLGSWKADDLWQYGGGVSMGRRYFIDVTMPRGRRHVVHDGERVTRIHDAGKGFRTQNRSTWTHCFRRCWQQL